MLPLLSSLPPTHPQMTDSPSLSTPAGEASDTTVDRIVGAVGTLAQHLLRSVKLLTGTAALAGATLWWALWGLSPFQTGAVAGPVLTLALLLAPAVVLGLFYTGLRDLAALPDRLSTGVSQTLDASVASYRAATDAPDSWWGWGRRIFSRLWALRSLLADHRALLVRYGMMLRVVTPGFLLLVVGATLATGVLVPGAALALVVAALL